MQKNFTSRAVCAPQLCACLLVCLLLFGLFPCAQSFLPRLNAQQLIAATGATHRIFFRDKGGEAFEPGTALYARTEALHSERSLQRRKKSYPAGSPLLTLHDAPVYAPYLDSLKRLGASVLLALRWRNYALVTCSDVQLAQIRSLSFVRATQRAAERLHPANAQTPQRRKATPLFAFLLPYASTPYAAPQLAVLPPERRVNCGTLRYGGSQTQLESVNILPAHEIGITGQNVIIGVIDTGFRWREQESLAGATVLAEYDFIQNDTITANQSFGLARDLFNQDDHGTKVFSLVGGYAPNNLIGAAFNAQFLLAKTEDLRYERHIEQDNAAAALEWMEARGADIINASLGYMAFDAPDESYRFDELDGKTTILSRAVNDAAERGVLCVVSAGNEGRGGWRTITTPADADGAFAVAALEWESLTPTDFSSRGPRAGGGIKPDIAAQGESVVVAAPSGRAYQTGDGTSFAAPIVAGGAALLLSAFPELTAREARALLQSSASQSNAPDSVLGYGAANIFAALKKAGSIVSPDIVSYPLTSEQRVGISALPSDVSLKATLYVRFRGESSLTSFPLQPLSRAPLFLADIPFSRFGGEAAECYVITEDARTRRRMPTQGFFSLQPRKASVPCGIPGSALPINKPNGSPEGVFPSPITADAPEATIMLITPDAEQLEYAIFNSFGALVSQKTVGVGSGVSFLPFRTAGLSRGAYFVRVRSTSGVRVFRFMVH